MSVMTWFLGSEVVKAAIELYMVEEHGVPLDDIRSIVFSIIDGEQVPEFNGAEVSFDDPGEREYS